MNLLLVALLLATQAPGAQDTVAQVLLRLEDDWAVGLTRRDAALFRRLLADEFIYTEDDRTVGRDDVLRDVAAGPDTVETAHNEDMKVHRFGTTAIVTGWLVVAGHGPKGPFSRRYRFTDTWVRQGAATNHGAYVPQAATRPARRRRSRGYRLRRTPGDHARGSHS